MKTLPKQSFLTAWIVVLCATLLTSAAVKAQAPAQAKGYEAFKGMRTRNIFDPDRRGPRNESAPPTTTSNRPDFLALTGTMVSSGKTLAFFTGSKSDYSRVIAVSDKIADYTVTGIDSARVNLERDGKPLAIEVGKQLSLDGSGKVSAISSETTASSSSSSFTSTSSPSAAPGSPTSPPAGVPADKAEILRRMMERRQQENSK